MAEFDENDKDIIAAALDSMRKDVRVMGFHDYYVKQLGGVTTLGLQVMAYVDGNTRLQQPLEAGDITGLATAAKQDVLATAIGNIETEVALKADLTETQPVQEQAPLNQGVVLADLGTLATHAKQDTLLTELQAKADLTETQPVQEQSPLNQGVVLADLATLATHAKQDTLATAIAAVETDVTTLQGDNYKGLKLQFAAEYSYIGSLTGTTITIDATDIPSNEIWKITHVRGRLSTTGNWSVSVGASVAIHGFLDILGTSIARADCEMWLVRGDIFRFIEVSGTATLYCGVRGIKYIIL